MGMKTVQEVYDDYQAWCAETGNSITFEEYLWQVCS